MPFPLMMQKKFKFAGDNPLTIHLARRYVAMHAMQEDSSSHNPEGPSGANGYPDAMPTSQRKPKGPEIRDTFATVAGMLLPLLTQFGHHH